MESINEIEQRFEQALMLPNLYTLNDAKMYYESGGQFTVPKEKYEVVKNVCIDLLRILQSERKVKSEN